MKKHVSPGRGAPGAIRPLLAGVAVIAIVLAVTLLRKAPVAAPEPTAPPAPAQDRPVQRPATDLRRKAMAPERLADWQARRAHAQAEQVRRGRALHDALAARYAAEPVDAAWAAVKEARLLAASVSDEIRRTNAVPENYRASCRSTVCRIGADFPDRGAAEDWLTLFSTGTGGELPNEAYIVTQDPDGGIHLEIMGLARK